MKILFIGSKKFLESKEASLLETSIYDADILRSDCVFVDVNENLFAKFCVNTHRAVVTCDAAAKKFIKAIDISHPKPDVLHLALGGNLKKKVKIRECTRLLKDLTGVARARQN